MIVSQKSRTRSSAWVIHIHRIIEAIGEHVIAQQALAGGDIAVGIEESTPLRVIISALEIIQPGFVIVVIAAVAKRIQLADGVGLAAFNGQYLAPGIIGVDHHQHAAAVEQRDHITLQIQNIEVFRNNAIPVGVPQGEGPSACIVREVQRLLIGRLGDGSRSRCVGCGGDGDIIGIGLGGKDDGVLGQQTIHIEIIVLGGVESGGRPDLQHHILGAADAQTISRVPKDPGLQIVGHAGQFPTTGPVEVPCAVGCGVAVSVVGNCLVLAWAVAKRPMRENVGILLAGHLFLLK